MSSYTRTQRDIIVDTMSVCYYVADGNCCNAADGTPGEVRIPDELKEQLLGRLPAAEWEVIGEICEDWLDQHPSHSQPCVNDDAPEEADNAHICDIIGMDCVCDDHRTGDGGHS